MKRGFDFTLMVVGEAGLGKSTLGMAIPVMELQVRGYKIRKIFP